MNLHASSRERLPYLASFYQEIFSIIGKPTTILDLACALDPLGLPWMDLPPTSQYFAYDIHQPRLAFLRVYFQAFYPQAQAISQDILTDTPEQEADCAFFFKEAHRLEKRRWQQSRTLLQVERQMAGGQPAQPRSRRASFTGRLSHKPDPQGNRSPTLAPDNRVGWRRTVIFHRET